MRLPIGAGVLFVVVLVLLVTPAAAFGARSPTSGTRLSAAPMGLTTDAVPLPVRSASPLLPGSTPVGITLTLPYAHAGPLAAFLTTVESPTSSEYRQYLTAAEFRAEFSPTPAAVSSVAAVLLAHGAQELSVGPNSATVSALLPASAVESLFGVQLRVFEHHDGLPIYTAVGSATLPASLDGRVIGIGGLTNVGSAGLSLGLTHSLPERVSAGSPAAFVDTNTSEQWFLGSDFTQAYGANELFPGGSVGAKAAYPTHEAIATLLFSSWNESSGKNLPPWDPNVVYTYFNNTTAPAWPKAHLVGVPVPILGQSAPLPGTLGALNDTTGAEFENSLDLEMAGDLAPGASIFNFYIPGSVVQNTSAVDLTDLADDFAAALTAALNYNYSGLGLGVVTGSFGLPDLNDSAWNSALEEAAATGVTVAIASGDQGNAPDSLTGRSDGQWPTWPATAAFNSSGVVSVGGVSLSIHGVPTAVYNGGVLNVTFDSNETGISGMSAWWNNLGPQGTWSGSEGGLSTAIPEPFWQFHSAAQPAIASAGGTQGASLLGRAGPDIAFPANSTLAYVYADANESLYFAILQGTSIASPVFAGLLADEIAVSGHSFGYLDPELYRMGSYYTANPSPSDPFLDVTVGGNYVFSTAPGWDAVTGWGGLAAPLFLTALANSTVDNFTYSGPTPGLPSSSSGGSTFPWTAVVLIVVLAVAASAALAVAFGRPRRSSGAPPPAAWGPPPNYMMRSPLPGDLSSVQPPHGPPPVAVATFLCPYCGAPRPAEPVRCPRCGAL